MLLEGINHVAWLTKDPQRLSQFYETVFEATVQPTRDHGPGETMTIIRIGPSTELNIFCVEDNTEADRQVPMFGRGRIDHVGLQAASKEAFLTILQRLVEAGAGDGTVNDFGGVLSTFFATPTGWRARSSWAACP